MKSILVEIDQEQEDIWIKIRQELENLDNELVKKIFDSIIYQIDRLRDDQVVIQINKINKDATIPSKKNETDACFDLFALEETKIEAGDTVLVSTGIRVIIPEGYEGVIRPRSGMSIHFPNYVGNNVGTIDSQYRDEVKVIFSNNKDTDITLEKGAKFAQIGFRKIPDVELKEIDDTLYEDIKSKTNRGGGFGSTGK